MQVDELNLSHELRSSLGELGVIALTPIQAEAIPLLMQGKDLVAQAQTGSGKTFAFAIPAIEAVDLSLRSPQVLVLCPTRELSTQVAREIRKLGRHKTGLHVILLAGGMPIGPQYAALEHGAHIVVGTPGRICDHLQRRSLRLHRLKTIVLDEADRILEMGFAEDIEYILKASPRQRQTVFFSATYPETIATLSASYQKQAHHLVIEGTPEALPDITHRKLTVESRNKFDALLSVLQTTQPPSAIVFCNMKATTAEVAAQLSEKGLSAAALHGDLEQYDRDQVMARFRNRSIRILVATDVAARGIDVHNLDAVINYDMPIQPEIYVHRVGRTGRAGLSGLALSFVTPREAYKTAPIEALLNGKTLESAALNEFENTPAPVGPLSRSAMETIRISAGRKDKMRPGDILGALTGEAGKLKATDVGKIEIYDRYSYVAVTQDVATLAFKGLSEGRIKGRKLFVEWIR